MCPAAKVKFEVRRIDVIQRQDAAAPTFLTVSCSGWLPLPVLRASLSLQPVMDGSERCRQAGSIQLHQTFNEGEGPRFSVKGGSKLNVALHAGWRVRTRASVPVTYLLSHCKEHPCFLVFDAKRGGRGRTEAYLQVVQVGPDPTPRVPDVRPFMFSYFGRPSPVLDASSTTRGRTHDASVTAKNVASP